MISRRDLLRSAVATAAALALPVPLRGFASPPGAAEARVQPVPPDALGSPEPEDAARLLRWTRALREEGLHRRDVLPGRPIVRVGELAVGTPYEAYTLEAYLKAGGSPPRTESLTLSLTRFDCVSLVEACIAVSRVAAADSAPTWERFGAETERLRYRGGERRGYTSRLHYFSEWIRDNERRGGMRDLGRELGGVADTRPLRFMGTHRESYPALADDAVFAAIRAHERSLDDQPRWVIPTTRIPAISDRIRTGDVLAFATSIEGLDVTHSAFAYRDPAGVLRVLHAPLSGGAVEVTRSTVPEYVAAIRRSTGILVARPLWV